MSYTVSDTVPRTETQWITLRASFLFPSLVYSHNVSFPFHTLSVCLCFSKVCLRFGVSHLSLPFCHRSVLCVPCRSWSAGLTFTEDPATVKWWTQNKGRNGRERVASPALQERKTEEMRAGEKKQRRGAWMWFGKWLLFPEAIRLWSWALHHWLHCQASFLSSFPHTLLLLQIQIYPHCQYIYTSLKKLSVNNEVPPLLASLSPLWEHAAAAVP